MRAGMNDATIFRHVSFFGPKFMPEKRKKKLKGRFPAHEYACCSVYVVPSTPDGSLHLSVHVGRISRGHTGGRKVTHRTFFFLYLPSTVHALFFIAREGVALCIVSTFESNFVYLRNDRSPPAWYDARKIPVRVTSPKFQLKA